MEKGPLRKEAQEEVSAPLSRAPWPARTRINGGSRMACCASAAEKVCNATVWDWSPYFPAQFRRERFTMFYRAFEPRDEEDAWQIMDDWRAQGECEGPFQCGG